MVFIGREPVAQVHQALTRVVGVAAVRKLPEQILKRFEGKESFFRRSLGDVDAEQPLNNIRFLIEVDHAHHVEAVSDLGCPGILANERLGDVDGRLGLAAAVKRVDQIELRLPRDRCKGVANDQVAKAHDRRRRIASLQKLRAFVVELLSADLQERVVAVAAAAQKTEGCNAENCDSRQLRERATLEAASDHGTANYSASESVAISQRSKMT